MTFPNRRRLILQTVADRGEVNVRELAQLLQTSEITVRRDLGTLAAEGLLHRTHGGAMRPDWVEPAATFSRKAVSHTEQKEVIARLAATEIQDGEVLFLDCGSTVFRLCPLLRDRRVRVVTNSLPVVQALLGSSVQLNLVGGEVDPAREAVHGVIAEEHIARYRADRAFVGVDGISVENGLSAHSEHEASITRAMARQAKTTYLLCDSSKLGRDRYLAFAPLTLAQVLVTDAPYADLAGYEAAGLRVICPENASGV